MTLDNIIKISTIIFVIFGIGETTSNSGFFWHVTDMHWDPTYTDKTVGLSCNDRSKPSYGKYGDFLCDSPWLLVESAIEAMKEVKPNPDFLIWTGDDTPHIWNDNILNQERVLQIIFNLTDVIQDLFPNIPVYSALGNHDWSPKSQFPAENHEMYDVIADYWKDWLSTDAEETFRAGGYYTLQFADSNIRAVVLNTNLYYKSNKLTGNMTDPANQFKWLDDTLTAAEQKLEKVIIIGHVPPGMFEKHRNYNWFYPEYNEMFLGLIKKHKSTVASVHFAHHHTDSFRVLYDEEQPIASMFLAPAVAPWETTLDGVMGGTGNNPGIRLVEYNKTTGAVMDIHQYYLNLTEANLIGNDKWILEYKATEYYSQPDMSTESLHNIAQDLWLDGEVFTKYYLANGVFYDPDEKWDYETRIVHYCSATELYYENYDFCYNKYRETSAAANLILNSITILVVSISQIIWHNFL